MPFLIPALSVFTVAFLYKGYETSVQRVEVMRDTAIMKKKVADITTKTSSKFNCSTGYEKFIGPTLIKCQRILKANSGTEKGFLEYAGIGLSLGKSALFSGGAIELNMLTNEIKTPDSKGKSKILDSKLLPTTGPDTEDWLELKAKTELEVRKFFEECTKYCKEHTEVCVTYGLTATTVASFAYLGYQHLILQEELYALEYLNSTLPQKEVLFNELNMLVCTEDQYPQVYIDLSSHAVTSGCYDYERQQ